MYLQLITEQLSPNCLTNFLGTPTESWDFATVFLSFLP